jgi:hypothetical protein
MNRLQSETQPLKITRCGRPQENYIIKLQKRVLAGAATLQVRVKTHRGDPLNEETDIRAEMGHRKEQQEVGWNNPTNRTIY